MERARRPPPPPLADAAAAAAAAMSVVLGNDDLLRKILLRLGLPTSLLRAALVCRRWYRLASDSAFLRRFRDRNNPRILGVYLNTSGTSRPRFLKVRPLAELAAVARRAGSFFDAFDGSSAFVHDSRGSRILIRTSGYVYGHSESTHLLCSPMSAAGDTVVVPPPLMVPRVQLAGPLESVIYEYGEFLPVNGEAHGRSYFCVLVGHGDQQTAVHLYELQDMYWVPRSSAAVQLPVTPPGLKVMLFDDSKFYYILADIIKILVFDFPSSSISAMDLPNGVENDDTCSVMLSRGDGSGIYLVHVKESLLRIFRCTTGGDNSGKWSLVDNICLRKVCANLGMTTWTSVEGHDADVKLHAVDDNAKFVFLEMFGAIFFLDVASTQAEKVYEIRPEDKELISVHPLMMPSPVFPMLGEG
ncbi:hypothetical protein EJB05_24134, partial [Eragrostis curvula]